MVDEKPTTKRCPKCERTKPLADFHRCKRRPDGRNVYCRACHSVWAKAHYLKKSPEQKAAAVARNQANRRKQIKATPQLDAGRQRQRRNSALFRERHLGAERERVAAWHRANPEKRVAKEAKRRAKKAGSAGQYTADDLAAILRAQSGKCAYCRQRLGRKYHADHIVALTNGGANDRKNIQLLCARCNLSKGAKDPLLFARQLGRLI